MTFQEIINHRRSVRQYKDTPIDAERVKHCLELASLSPNSPKEKQPKRVKTWELYYGKVIPILYSRFFGIQGIIRKLLVSIVGLFRPITCQVSECDVRVVVHKTCPMEGLDSRRIKKILNLPHGAEINMVISCGLKEERGVWGDRMRVPFEDVYKRD
jgi:nitroreductase